MMPRVGQGLDQDYSVAGLSDVGRRDERDVINSGIAVPLTEKFT